MLLFTTSDIDVKVFSNAKINNLNPYYFIIGKTNGYIEESNRN